MQKLKAFLRGFDYAVKRYNQIEDHHFQSLPGAKWFDIETQSNYRKGVFVGRKYMQYRYEVLALCVIVFTTLLFMFTW